MTAVSMNIMKRVHFVLELRSQSLMDLAEKTGSSEEFLIGALEGREEIGLDLMNRIADVLNLPVTFFLRGTENAPEGEKAEMMADYIHAVYSEEQQDRFLSFIKELKEE